MATPGAEPPAEGGYAGAVLLDTTTLLLRPDLRAAEEALRRWLNVVALVRSGADGGSVIAAGESAGRALQALVRTDPAGFAGRELAERAEAGFPPAVTDGAGGGPRRGAGRVRDAGPAAAGDRRARTGRVGACRRRPRSRCSGSPCAAPRTAGPALVRAVQEVMAIRSARKSDGALRVVVDPVSLG